MPKEIKEYTNGEITVVWDQAKCIHSANCVNGLPPVFDPKTRPWINAEGATSQEIADQIDKCPSGALSYYYNDQSPKQEASIEGTNVEVTKNGPLLVYGNLSVKDPDGKETTKQKVTAFCRCGASANKPYCDGMHKKVGFEG